MFVHLITKEDNIVKLVQSSYSSDDVKILLQDIAGKVEILDTAEREKRIQSGTHYSEMLPLEYKPTEDYMKVYEDSLKTLSYETAVAVKLLAEEIWKRKNGDVTIISLARAGTPIGILVKRYIKYRYGVDIPHYSISIIRGKGIDVEAMRMILMEHSVSSIQFLDGWVGKGAINNVLSEAVKDLKSRFSDIDNIDSLDDTLAVLSDPAYVTDACGTHADFLIPSACLNATVSGLISRTVKLQSMTDDELHGAVYYKDYEGVDKSNEFIDTVTSYFDKITSVGKEVFNDEVTKGLSKVDLQNVMKDFGVRDVNLVKPGVGETTRVLLRRIPDVILIKKGALEDEKEAKYLQHILRLAKEKNVRVEEYNLLSYSVIGVIKDLGDI